MAHEGREEYKKKGWVAVVDEGGGRYATVVDDGKGKWVYVFRSGSRVGGGTGGCMCDAVWMRVRAGGLQWIRWVHVGTTTVDLSRGMLGNGGARGSM